MKDKKWSKPIEGEWASTLCGYIKTLQDKVPEEWKTIPQVLESFGLTHTHGGGRHLLLADMVKRGFLECKRFRVIDASGRRVLPLNHYRIVKQPTSFSTKSSQREIASSKSSPSQKHNPK